MKSFYRFFSFFKEHKLFLFEALLSMLILNILNIPFPFFMKMLVDDVLVMGDTQMLHILFVLMFALVVARNVFSLIRNYVLNIVGYRIDFSIRFQFYSHLLKLGQSFFDERYIGEIMARFEDIGKVRSVVSSILLDLGTDLFSLVLYVIFMFVINVKLTILALIVVPLFSFSTLMLNKYFRRVEQELFTKESELGSLNFETLAGIRIIKAFSLENRMIKRLKLLTLQLRKITMKAMMVGSVNFSFADILATLGSYLVLWQGGLTVINNEMSIGSLMAFYTFVGYIFGPIKGLLSVNTRMQSAIVAADRFYKVMDMKEEQQPHLETHDIKKVYGELEFKNIRFSYDGERTVLDGINLKIKAGQTVAVVGRSGAGKTTLSNLVPRFYIPQEGTVLLDGVDIARIKLQSLRRNIGIVPQINFLFTGSIRENINIGRYRMDENSIIQAAMAANAHDFISELPKGYDTQIGERGIRLSGGQQQRISIARMLAQDPKVLILDEATSSLDLENERLIQEALARLLKGRTAIVIAHRLSTIINSDLIVVLDQGRIIETGKHVQLVRKKGLYYSLYQRMGRI